jgi:hypothetical protein
MIAIIVDDHIHRITRVGLPYSAPIYTSVNEEGNPSIRVVDEQWERTDPSQRNMTDGELETIRMMLKQLASYFPKGRKPLPVNENRPIEEPAPQSTLGD